jgi:hypothetical protein
MFMSGQSMSRNQSGLARFFPILCPGEPEFQWSFFVSWFVMAFISSFFVGDSFSLDAYSLGRGIGSSILPLALCYFGLLGESRIEGCSMTRLTHSGLVWQIYPAFLSLAVTPLALPMIVIIGAYLLIRRNQH